MGRFQLERVDHCPVGLAVDYLTSLFSCLSAVPHRSWYVLFWHDRIARSSGWAEGMNAERISSCEMSV